MANEFAKYLNSRRRQKDDNAVARQLRIARQHGLSSGDAAVKQPHRMAKRHAMDCGRPGCYLCGNRRRHGEITVQEQRLFQDVDHVRESHSNGLEPGQEQND